MMLQRIHERITGWIAGVIIALVAGAFALFGVEYYFQQGAGEKNVAATVNGEKITNQEVHTAYSQLLRHAMMEMGGKSLPDALKKQVKAMALQSLVTNTALITTLKKEGFGVSQSQVKHIIATAPEFQENGAFSQSRFQQVLMQVGLTPMALLNRIENELVINQAMNGIGAGGFALPKEVVHLYQVAHQKRAFGYALISPKVYESMVTVSDKDAKEYYLAHQKDFQTPRQVSVNYILLSPKAIEKTVTVTLSQARAYYDSNLMNYQVPAQWKVQQVTLPIAKNGTNQAVSKVKAKATLMAKAWQDGKSPKNMTVETISGADAPKVLLDRLRSLKANQVSEPLRTTQGFSLLKVISYTPKKTRTFASVQKKIIAMLKHQRVNQILSSQASRLSDLAFTTPDSLKPAAKALGLTVQTSKMFTDAGDKTGLFANKKVLKTVFSDSVYRDGNNSDPIVLSDGRQVVVRVHKKVPSQQKPFSVVEKQIKKMLKQKQVAAKAGVAAYQLQQQLKTAKHPEAVAKKAGFVWHAVSLVAPDDKSLGKIPQITSTVFSTPVSGYVSKNKTPIGVNTVLLSNNDYAVIAISRIENAGKNIVSSQQEKEITKSLTQLYVQLLHDFYVKSVVASSKIEKNN